MMKKESWQDWLERFLPFMVLGIAIVVAVKLVQATGYLLIWGILIGLVLYLIFSLSQTIAEYRSKKHKHDE